MPKPKMIIRGRLNTLKLTAENAADAVKYGEPKKTPGTFQKVFAEVADEIKEIDGEQVTRIYDDRLSQLKHWAGRKGNGGCVIWCREVLAANGISW